MPRAGYSRLSPALVGLICLLPGPAFGRQLTRPDSLTASTFIDEDQRPISRIDLEWEPVLPIQGAVQGSLSLLEIDGSVRNGRSALKWQASIADGTLSVNSGTFFVDPSRSSRRPHDLFMRSALSRGLQTEYARGGTTIGFFRGTFLKEEGSRIRTTRTTSDRILGAYVSRQIHPDVTVTIETDQIRTPSSIEPVRQLRPSMRWKVTRNVSVEGEWSVSNQGSPSFHVALERQGRVSVWAAYIKRQKGYLPYGQLIASRDREGPIAETSVQATDWLTLSAGLMRYRTDIAEGRRSLVHSQTRLSASIQLPARLRLVVTRTLTGRQRPDQSGQGTSARSDSIRITRSIIYRALTTQVQAEHVWQSADSDSHKTDVRINEIARLSSDLTLSGQVRWQENRTRGARTARLLTMVKGAYAVGPVSLEFQSDSARPVRPGTATGWQFRFSRVGVVWNVWGADTLGFEYSRTSSYKDVYYFQYKKSFG